MRDLTKFVFKGFAVLACLGIAKHCYVEYLATDHLSMLFFSLAFVVSGLDVAGT